MPQLQTLYRCTDGTPFPVGWDDPADAERPWLQGATHTPDPLPPLEIALLRLAQPGVDRAFAEAMLPVPYDFQRGCFANGYQFLDGRLFTDADWELMLPSINTLLERYGNALAVWEQYCLPRLQAAVESLQTDGPEVPLAWLAETWGYAMHQTQVALVVVSALMRALAQFCATFAGSDAERLASDLTTGVANLTLEADQSLWELAQQVRATPALAAAVAACAGSEALTTLHTLPGGRGFLAAFEAFLERWGSRAQSWELLAPTWRERPEIPLLLLRRLITDSPPSPYSIMQAAAQSREALVQATEARLENDVARERFRTLLAAVSDYVTVREGRAYWQLHTYGAWRGAVLRRGETLVAAGLIDCTEDVLFLLPEELDAPPHVAELRERVAARRAERERWRLLEPPTLIGAAPAPNSAVARAPASEPAPAGELRGIGASRGAVTARARVIIDLDDADRLQPGEVLVCRMTSPAWTPLLTVAGAVITEAGSLLSHASITAREYGIPCVVAVKSATRLLEDGALITVDGEAGIVRTMAAS